MLMLIGKGGEGKSRIGVVMNAIFGLNMNTTSIQKVENSRFARADLEGKLLMLDEPSLGLAPIVVREIFDIIRTVNQQGITVLLNEQNANMALKVADYAYVLETGTLTLSGTGTELLADESVKAAYLGKKRN